MHLGDRVLSKIENLIVQIDKSKKKTTFKSSKFIKEDEEEKQNQDIFEKLYNMSKIKKVQDEQRVKMKIEKVQRDTEPFKITNKHTIFLNNQSKRKPFYSRIQEIQQTKQRNLELLREKYPKKQQVKVEEDEQLIKELEERRKNEKKYTKKQLNQKIQEMKQKQKERIERLHLQKIKAFEKYSQQFRCKPYVKKSSQILWNKYQLKKQLSSSVFQRFEQYEMQRKQHLEDHQEKLRNSLTPFNPRISTNSRIMASRSKSKKSLHQNLSRSISCKCFQRPLKKYHNSTALHSSRYDGVSK